MGLVKTHQDCVVRYILHVIVDYIALLSATLSTGLQ